jgi:replicative DNA helicase
MKSRNNQKRIRRSFRILRGGQPITKTQVETTLVSAQNSVSELTTMLTLMEKNATIPKSSIESALASANSLVSELSSMLATVKKETSLPSSAASTASAAVVSSSSAPVGNEPEDWWKVGPSDRSSTISSEYYSQFV